ncbi:hypothetical protein OIO90_004397 [Microbotryomycetes sp. JL221]|nr:hypothetical protein OIO90_004397 [Microbotryomycetes sp. JL221]
MHRRSSSSGDGGQSTLPTSSKTATSRNSPPWSPRSLSTGFTLPFKTPSLRSRRVVAFGIGLSVLAFGALQLASNVTIPQSLHWIEWSKSSTTRTVDGLAVNCHVHNGSRASIAAATEQVPPTCEPCLRNPQDKLCEYGMDNIRLSRAYEGSGHRVRKVIEKALSGQQVRIGLLGSSAGHGILTTLDARWQYRFLKHFQQTFPQTLFYDGASPGMNSEFFSYCFSALIPNDLDLYLIEVDINNEFLPETYRNDDNLMRALLTLPQQPAVIRIQVFALWFSDMMRGAASSIMTSQWLDVPVISVRNWLLPQSLKYPDEAHEYFSKDAEGNIDWRHMGHASHRALADMLSLYMKQKICEVEREAQFPSPATQPDTVWPERDMLETVPRQWLWQAYDHDSIVPPVHPQCSLSSANLTALTGSHHKVGSNWSKIEWNDKQAFQSSSVGSRVTFQWTGVQVGLFVWTWSGEGNVSKPGRAWCFVDNDFTSGKEIDAFAERAAAGPVWHVVAEDLPYGTHTISCQVMATSSTTGHDVRIIGLASL